MLNKFNFKLKDFTSDSQIKPELNGIYISPKESVATDTFLLIRVQAPNFDLKDYPLIPNEKVLTNFKSFILPKEKAESILKNLPQKTNLPILENAVLLKQEKDFVEIGMTDLESSQKIRSRVIEGQFPNYKEILTKKGRYRKIIVNKKLLKKIVNFFDGFDDRKTNELEIEFSDDEKQPIRFSGERKATGQKAEVLLMKIKSE